MNNTQIAYTICGILSILIWTTNVYPFRSMMNNFDSFATFAIIFGLGGIVGLITYNINLTNKRTQFNYISTIVILLFVSSSIFSSLVFGASPIGDVLLQTIIINSLWTVLVNIGLVTFLNYQIKNHLLFYLGIMMAVIGVILSCVGFDLNRVNFIKYVAEYYYFYIYAIISCLSWALYSIFLKKHEDMFEDDHVFIGLTVTGGICAIIFLIKYDETKNIHHDTNIMSVLCILYEIIIFSYLSHHFWNIGIKKGCVKIISHCSLLSPVLNVIFASVFYNLNIMNGELFGAIILVIAIFFCKYSITERQFDNTFLFDEILNPIEAI